MEGQLEMNLILPDTISNSRVNTFLDCYKKYELRYIRGIKTGDTKHTWFGTKVHSFMEEYVDSGEMIKKREEDEVISSKEREWLEELKISSLPDYYDFLQPEVDKLWNDNFDISKFEVIGTEVNLKSELFKMNGVIDLILYDKTTKTVHIYDYKTSSKDKTIETIETDGQLYKYALLVASNQEILKPFEVDDVVVGYINLPKYLPIKPKVLKNGKLSVAKTQNTTRTLYMEAIDENKLDPPDYEEFIETLDEAQHITMARMKVDVERANKIADDHKAIYEILRWHYGEGLFPESHDSWKCSQCDYYKICKGGM